MNIRSFPHCLNLLLLVCITLLATSCEEEIPEEIIAPQAQDGLYLAVEGEYPDPFARLTEGKVADPSQLDSLARPMVRNGFVAGYMYLVAGNYQLVNVVDKKVVESERIGGTASTEEAGMGCGGNLIEYTLVQAEDNGKAFPVNETGLHKVTYDETTGEIILFPIYDVSFVGSAVDTTGREVLFDKYKNLDATGGIWHKSEYEMFQGDWKVRFNCMNMIERGEFDLNGPVSKTAYRLYTTLGGSEDFPEAGGAFFKIGIDDVAAYNMDIVWYPETGWNIGPNKIEINPGNFRWQIDFEPYDEDEIPYEALDAILYGSLFEDLVAIQEANPDVEFTYLDKVEGKHEWKIDSIFFNPVNFKLITIDSDGDLIPEGILVDRTLNFSGFTSNIPLTSLDNYLYYQDNYRAPYKITDTVAYSISIFTRNEGVKWNVLLERKP